MLVKVTHAMVNIRVEIIKISCSGMAKAKVNILNTTE